MWTWTEKKVEFLIMVYYEKHFPAAPVSKEFVVATVAQSK